MIKGDLVWGSGPLRRRLKLYIYNSEINSERLSLAISIVCAGLKVVMRRIIMAKATKDAAIVGTKVAINAGGGLKQLLK